MQKKLLYLAIAITGLFAACSDEEDMKFPEILGIKTEYNIKKGSVLELVPIIKNQKNPTYEWILNNNNKTLSKEPKLKFQSKEKGSFNLILQVSGDNGIINFPFIIHVYDKYRYGIFILSEGNMGNETGTLSFINPEGIAEDSIFIKANEGKKLGNSCQDMAIANGMVYIISQNGNKNDGLGKLVIADAETMKLEKVIDKGLEGITTNISVPNKKWGYVVSTTKNQGIIPINLNLYIAEKVIPGTEKASKLKMSIAKNKVFAAAESDLLVIDGNKATKIKSIEMGGKITGISRTSKGHIMVSITQNNNVVLKIVDAENYSVSDVRTIKNLTTPGFITSALCCDAKEEKTAYIFRAMGWDVPNIEKSSESGIKTIISLPNDIFPNMGKFYGPLSVNPETGNIYFGYIKDWGEYKNNGIAVITPEGKKIKDYNSMSADVNTKIDTRFCAGIYFTEPFSLKE